MKRIVIALVCVVSGFMASAQWKQEQALVERTYLLSHTIFGTKDSTALQDLFAAKATYGHSGGKVETRDEAVRNIQNNQSVYTDTSVSNVRVLINGDVAIVRHLFNATETAKDGKVTPLHFTMMLVWVREKGKWKLMGRQATKIS